VIHEDTHIHQTILEGHQVIHIAITYEGWVISSLLP